MFAIEFETKLRHPSIEIPNQQWEQLRSRINGDSVRIIVLTESKERNESTLTRNGKSLTEDAQDKGYDDFIKYLMDYPVSLPPGETYLSREEANAR